MNLQQFADRHGLQVKNYGIQGPHGEIYQAGDLKFYYFTRYRGTRKFNPKIQAKLAIKAIGLPYTAPAEEIKAKQDRRAFLIVKKADGWYVADRAGPFKTREEAREARARLRAAIDNRTGPTGRWRIGNTVEPPHCKTAEEV